jgi:aspartyl-tRNA(Asn)/glutamyl-tRNA(Gln) amidotransferase subunit C
MVHFTKEELLKIAKLSALSLDDQEVALFEKHLQVVLSYTSELEGVITQQFQQSTFNVNVFREDKAIEKDSSLLLQEAPKTHDSFFVVPKIL